MHVPNISPSDDVNLFLDEDKLIALALKELKGRRPKSNSHNKYESPASSSAWKEPTKLAKELTARGWVIADLAKVLEVSAAEAAALTHGHMRINRDIAQKAAKAFATSEEFWLS